VPRVGFPFEIIPTGTIHTQNDCRVIDVIVEARYLLMNRKTISHKNSAKVADIHPVHSMSRLLPLIPATGGSIAIEDCLSTRYICDAILPLRKL
jgi:hypothetical protein